LKWAPDTDPKAVEAAGRYEAEASDGRLLYVGVTRARASLIITYCGEPTPLLPENDGLWSEIESPISAAAE